MVVFSGGNAQGKTTLLEAVYVLAIARSFRAENEREVLNFQAAAQGAAALVGGTIEKEGERVRVFVEYQGASRGGADDDSPRRFELGGLSVRKQIRVSRVRRTAAELVGMVNAVLFSADDIQLVQGPPSGRRRFLDVLLCQADTMYLKALQRYQRVVQQRNQLLRMLREGRAGPDELAFWNDELVREGALITWRRQEVMQSLAWSCADHHSQLATPDEDFEVSYQPSVPIGVSLEDTESRFCESLEALAERERATGSTAVGPHRDDFDLLIDRVPMRPFASRGQARTLALCLRLAEASYLASARGEGPIVLLDDVLSEMDAGRRSRVLEKAAQYQQSLITTTDAGPLHAFFGPSATYFRVAAGEVYPCQ